MKYFRTYPWGMQLLLFFLMVFTLLSFGSFLTGLVLQNKVGINFAALNDVSEKSSPYLISVKLWVQAALSIFIFALPAFVFAYLAHPEAAKYIGFKKPGKASQLLLSIVIMVGAIPLLISLGTLMGHLNFGASVKASEAAAQRMQQAYFNMPTLGDFIRIFTIMAIIPGLGEEMFFRGILLRFSHKQSKNMPLAIFFTAIIFAFAHYNVYGFVSIFISGILLASIYYLTGSLWCNALAHISFNGTQIALSYFGGNNSIIKTLISSDTPPVWLVITGVAVSGGALYLLIKQKTPLPPSWSDDFDNLPNIPENA